MRPFYKLRHVGKFLFKLTGIANGHNWRVSLKKFCRLKVLLIQFFPVALSVIFLLVYAKWNFASVLRVMNAVSTLI